MIEKSARREMIEAILIPIGIGVTVVLVELISRWVMLAPPAS